MSSSIPPPDPHPEFLTRAAERMLAAQMIQTAAPGNGLFVDQVAADMIDLISQAVLVAVGLPDAAEQRAVLSALWAQL